MWPIRAPAWRVAPTAETARLLGVPDAPARPAHLAAPVHPTAAALRVLLAPPEFLRLNKNLFAPTAK